MNTSVTIPWANVYRSQEVRRIREDVGLWGRRQAEVKPLTPCSDYVIVTFKSKGAPWERWEEQRARYLLCHKFSADRCERPEIV